MAAGRWATGMTSLRDICRDERVEQVTKWRKRCFMHAGRNIAIIAAFRDDFRLSFFDAALLKDPNGVLERQGPNTQHPDMIRFTTNDGPRAMEPAIRATLREAMAYAEQGLRPPKTTARFEMPAELTAALAADPALAAAFRALTPGRQRSYVINLSGTKKPETRMARIAGFRSKIMAGKGALDR
ncbi:MAG: YdeI/OmpD-associated family protein [Pseudomonadota bacterium]